MMNSTRGVHLAREYNLGEVGHHADVRGEPLWYDAVEAEQS